MNRVALLIFVQLLGIGCATETTREAPTNTPHQLSVSVKPTPAAPTAAPSDTKDEKSVPSAFAGIDFKNFSYPTNLRGIVALEHGERVIPNTGSAGGDTFYFRSVNYSDITGDGTEEAIVQLLQVSCGGSCDGGSHLFYFYSAGSNKPQLLSKIETGSAAEGGCGLKSFVLKNRNLDLERFRVCRVSGTTFKSVPDQSSDEKFQGKFDAHSFTRFLLRFDGRRFVANQRQVFPFPPGNVMNYEKTVSVSN